ncbi:MAG: hypothetical protein HUK03_08175 [Bacteroidaceae bacterium]|nr:hypothetical protein [Bacteroidaceae bacterium]
MKILIKAQEAQVATWSKEVLESFGKGLHIYTRDDGFSYYGCVICIGDTSVYQEPDLFARFAEPHVEEDWERLRKDLWQFYRDNIQDTFGNRCSCGLFEFCHCH